MPFKRLLKCTHNLHFNMKNYNTMKNYLIVVLAVLGLCLNTIYLFKISYFYVFIL